MRSAIITIQNTNHLLSLTQKSLPISLPFPSSINNTIHTMLEAIKSQGKAAGLAASQVGINECIIACSFTGEIEDLETMINPAYTIHGAVKEKGWEACFSIPLTFANVFRWKTIHASYYTAGGDLIKKQLDGFPARVYQHECDHLDGILMTKQASEIKTFRTEGEFNDFLQQVRQERSVSLNKPSY